MFCTYELEALMRLAAARPSNSTFRGELEGLLDTGLEEPLVTVALSTIFMQLIDRQALRDDQSISQAHIIRKGLDQG